MFYHDTSVGTEHRDGPANKIHDGVVVSVVVRSAFRTLPRADGKVFDPWVLLSADRANLTRREPPVDLGETTAFSLNLVLDESEKLSPSDGSDGFGQMAILHHSTDIEVLADEDFTRVGDDTRQLVMKVLPLVRGLLLFPADFLQCLVIIIGAAMGMSVVSFAGQSTLQTPEPSLVEFNPPRVGNGSDVVLRTVMTEVLKSHIHRDDIACVRGTDRFYLIDDCFKTDGDEIPLSVPSDSRLEYVKARTHPVGKSASGRHNESDALKFGKNDDRSSSFVCLETNIIIAELGRVAISARFPPGDELREAGTSVEEVFICGLHMFDGCFQRELVALLQIWSGSLE